MNIKKLFLLDAYALIYRAYFAFIKNPRINSKGIDTSAVFGFTNTLLEIINKEKPTHLAVIFDTPKATQRHIDFPAYKAQREAMPEGLRMALPHIDNLLEAFNIPKLYKDGYEADDVIGTLAKKAEKEGFKVYMMTPDKDFAQLVTDNTFIYRPANKWQRATILGVPEVLEKFKVKRVDQVIDFLGMMGDAADNIPGIPGVGEKTAQKFIEQFDTMEGLFANSHKLKGKIKEKIENSKKEALMCKKLVTIITDVPIEFDSDALLLVEKDNEKVKKLFKKLEFRNLTKKIFLSKDDEKLVENSKIMPNNQVDLFSEIKYLQKTIKNYDFKYVDQQLFLTKIRNEVLMNEKFSIQTFVDFKEDSNYTLVGFSLSCNTKSAYYIPKSDQSISFIKELCENESIDKIGFDLKQTIAILLQCGINLIGKLFDIQIAHYLLHPEGRHNLQIIAENYLHIQIKQEEDVLGKGKFKTTHSKLDKEAITNYAAEMALVVFNLVKPLTSEMNNSELGGLFKDIEMPLTYVLSKMEKEGINLDVNMLKDYNSQLARELLYKQNTIFELAGLEFNILSPKQLGDVLFKNLKLVEKPKKTKSGQFSTSEDILKKLSNLHPIINEVLEFRELKKLLSTYVEALPKLINFDTNRLHTTFNQSVAATGRLSSANPNLQNIPIRTKKGMKIREAFIPKNKDYYLLAADYSQIELRIIASLSQDKSLINAFKAGEDIHSITASKVNKVNLKDVTKEMRSKAKAVNFGIIYGISPFGLSQNINISRKEAKEIIDNYFIQFPKIKEYMTTTIAFAKDKGYVETLMGRRRYLRDINSNNAVVRAVSERNAINAPIQGLAADIIKKAMIDIQRYLEQKKMKSKMLLQVHDELVFDMHKDEIKELKTVVKQKMEKVFTLEVPLTVELDHGVNWLEAH